MIVPSRSTKTAGDFRSREVMLEAADQFVTGNSGGSEFSNNHRARVIRDLRRLERRRVTNEREREHRNCGVAGAGNIEHVARFGRNVLRMFSLLEKHHALFAECDEEILHIPLLQELFPGADKIDILLWGHLRIATWNSGGPKCFCGIWFHRSDSAT